MVDFSTLPSSLEIDKLINLFKTKLFKKFNVDYNSLGIHFGVLTNYKSENFDYLSDDSE